MQSTPSEADHAFRYVRTFFNFCVKRGLIDASPVARLEAPSKGQSRERVLSPDELTKIWKQAEKIGYPYGTIVRLLILCGQRAAETAALSWSWIDDQGISLPSYITKNRRASRIPYGPLTKQVLATVPRTGDLLFPARGYTDKPFVGFGVSKIVLDECGVKNFTHHDLRRSYSTIMASSDVGAPIHVLEKLLNHSSGTLRGVASIYNRYSYWEEMREAVEKYESWFERVIAIEVCKQAGH
jgi:integrase